MVHGIREYLVTSIFPHTVGYAGLFFLNESFENFSPEPFIPWSLHQKVPPSQHFPHGTPSRSHTFVEQ